MGWRKTTTYFDIAVSLEVKHGKTAHVPQPINVNGKLAEKVDDRGCAWREREPENERCQHDAGEFRDERDRLHWEQLAKLGMHGLSVELCAPLVGEIVRVLDERLHENLRIEYSILFWDHAARNSDNATKDGKIEKDGSMGGNLEMEKEIRFNDGGEQEDGGKGPSYKSQEPDSRVNERMRG
jgi:hypothetical protein